jgi:hypothetical protein
MDIPGYMLVLTGTPELFPVIDEVFSPIVRQFKKLTVAPFTKHEETKDCIRKPLDRLGVSPESLFAFRSTEQIEEIHSVTGGRPYEIQLVCHILFRRVQVGSSQMMRLDYGVLEDVRKELEASQNVNARPILTRLPLASKAAPVSSPDSWGMR